MFIFSKIKKILIDRLPLAKEIKRLRNEVLELQQQRRELIEQSERDENELKFRIKKLKEISENSNKEFSSVLKEKSQLQEDINQYTLEKSKLEKEISDLFSRKELFLKERNEFDEIRAQNIEDYNKWEKSAEEQVEQLTSKLKTLQEQEEKLKSSIAQNQKRLEDLSGLEKEQQRNLENIQFEIDSYLQQKIKIQKEFNQLESRLNDTQSRIREEIQNLLSERQSITDEKTRVEKLLAQNLSEYKNWEAQTKLLSSDFKSLQLSIENLQKQDQDLKNSIAEKQKLIQEYLKQESEQKESLKYIQFEIQESLTRKDSIQKECKEIEKELQSCRLQLEETGSLLAEQQSIYNQITEQRQELEKLKNISSIQKLEYDKIKNNLNQIQSRLLDEQKSFNQITLDIETKNQEKENILSSISKSQVNLASLRNEYNSLLRDRDNLLEEIKVLQLKREASIPIDDEAIKKSTSIVELDDVLDPFKILSGLRIEEEDRSFVSVLWNQYIEPYWEHKDYPEGTRFLGAIAIPKEVSESILDFLANRIQSFEVITYEALDNYFKGWKDDRAWLKVFIFALSEFAYYYQPERFYFEFCERLKTKHSQLVEKTLRDIIDEGAKNLGLIEVFAGNSYLATLRLQNGVPIEHVLDLVELLKSFANQYSWDSISEEKPSDLAQLLLSQCQRDFAQHTRLIRFLKSCLRAGVEPISGKLVKGILLIKHKLRTSDLKFDDLKSLKTNELVVDLLKEKDLFTSFFFKYWDELFEVLINSGGLDSTNLSNQPRQKSVPERVKPLKSEELYLFLNEDDEIEVVLNAHIFWKSEWETLRGNPITISEANWQDTIPDEGDLYIPEIHQVIRDIINPPLKFCWKLTSQSGAVLYQWNNKNLGTNTLLLIFDSASGDYIPDITLSTSKEIIVFYHAEAKLENLENIEIFEEYIPCSINDWVGQGLYLQNERGKFSHYYQGKIDNFTWGYSEEKIQSNKPQLRGLHFPRKRTQFVDIPTLWYPPIYNDKELTLIIRQPDGNYISKKVTLAASEHWQKINLNPQYFSSSGKYRLELQNKHQENLFASEFILENPVFNTENLIINSSLYSRGDKIDILPINATDATQFWTNDLLFKNLWPFENINFQLQADLVTHNFIKVADENGNLKVNLSSMRDTLPEAKDYILSYQKFSENYKKIVVWENNDFIKNSTDKISPSKPVSKCRFEIQIYLNGSLSNQRSIQRKVIKKINEASFNLNPIQYPGLKEYFLCLEDDQKVKVEQLINNEVASLGVKVNLYSWGKI